MRLLYVNNGHGIGYFKATLRSGDMDSNTLTLLAKSIISARALGIYDVKSYARPDMLRSRLVVWKSGDAKFILRDTRTEEEKGI